MRPRGRTPSCRRGPAPPRWPAVSLAEDAARAVDWFDHGPPRADAREPTPGSRAEATPFAHNSERQFAKLLDFYGIAWEYEPTTFVLEWDRAGQPAQAFSPDFYLPAYDLYIEITTLNQKLVTKKNRKVRRLAELHPEVKVKVLYQRDYLNLLVKYGLEAPSQLAGIPLDETEPRPLRFD